MVCVKLFQSVSPNPSRDFEQVDYGLLLGLRKPLVPGPSMEMFLKWVSVFFILLNTSPSSCNILLVAHEFWDLS